MAALAAHPSPALASWDDTIVPALRTRLETESVILAKRMSIASITSADDTHDPSYSYSYNRSTRPSHDTDKSTIPSLATEPRKSSSTIPRPPQSNSINGMNGHGAYNAYPNGYPNGNTRAQSPSTPRPSDAKPTRIPVARPRTSSSSSYFRSETRAAVAATGADASDLYAVYESPNRFSPSPSPSPLHTPRADRSQIIDESAPFNTLNSKDSKWSMGDSPSKGSISIEGEPDGMPRMSSESAERPFEHWYRGDVARNGGVGEMRVARRAEMLRIANYGHALRQNMNARPGTGASANTTGFAAGRGRESTDANGSTKSKRARRRADSVAGIGERESFYLDEQRAKEAERVMDEPPPKLSAHIPDPSAWERPPPAQQQNGVHQDNGDDVYDASFYDAYARESQYFPSSTPTITSRASQPHLRSGAPSMESQRDERLSQSTSRISYTRSSTSPAPSEPLSTPRQQSFAQNEVPFQRPGAHTSTRSPTSSSSVTATASTGTTMGRSPASSTTTASPQNSANNNARQRTASRTGRTTPTSAQSLNNGRTTPTSALNNGRTTPTSAHSLASPGGAQQKRSRSPGAGPALHAAVPNTPKKAKPSPMINTSGSGSGARTPGRVPGTPTSARVINSSKDREVRGSVAEYPKPDGEADMSDAIPTWTQPVPRGGNWDEVVLPVVARKKGMDDHYEQADGSPRALPAGSIPVEPAPGTFGFDHSKYRPPRDGDDNDMPIPLARLSRQHPTSTPILEDPPAATAYMHTQDPSSRTGTSDQFTDLSEALLPVHGRDPTVASQPGPHAQMQMQMQGVPQGRPSGMQSPAPFAHYRAATVEGQDQGQQQFAAEMQEQQAGMGQGGEEEEAKGGCCKCTIM